MRDYAAATDELYKLLDANTSYSETGFVINLDSAEDEWHACMSTLGPHNAYSLMSDYLCDNYMQRYGEEFLFSNSCVAYEIEYHVDAYMCARGKKGYSRNITTLIYTKQSLIDHCKDINISTKDVHDFKQATMFGYRKGIRDIYKSTSKDPYDRRNIFQKIGSFINSIV